MAFSHRYTQYHLVYFFAALIVLVVLSPLAGQTGVGKYVIQVLFTLVIGTTVFTTSNNRKTLIIALVFAIPWLLLNWSGLADMSRPAGILSGIFLIFLNGFVFALILSRVSSATTVNANIINGALGLYLLIGVTWAVAKKRRLCLDRGAWRTAPCIDI